MAEGTSTDRVAAYLAVVEERCHVAAAHAVTSSQTAVLPRDLPALLAALRAVLGDHDDRGVYLGADECDHPEPSGIDEGWDADHPQGAGDVGRICLLTEIGRYCPACTQLVYEDDPVGDQYVDASSCIVLPVISAALLGEGGDGG